jgi:ATP adenylyltransferase/5',5'''-P-1,P-4-tetraphosphate phosphorylase II
MDVENLLMGLANNISLQLPRSLKGSAPLVFPSSSGHSASSSQAHNSLSMSNLQATSLIALEQKLCTWSKLTLVLNIYFQPHLQFNRFFFLSAHPMPLVC